MNVRRKVLTLVVLLGVVLAFVGCGPKQPVVQQYKFLNASADLRLAVLRGAGDYYTMGLVDEQTKTQIVEIDGFVQEAGKIATAKLNEVVMLENLRKLDPEAVTPDQYVAAMQAYTDAKAKFRAEWRRLLTLVDPWMMKWIQEAAAKD